MKRSIKNIICVCLMCILCSLIIFTMFYAKNNSVNNLNGMPDFMNSGDGTPPEMSNGNNGEAPPEMPNEESGEAPPEKPDGENGEAPPEMPNGESGEAPPEMPNGESGGTPPEMPGNSNEFGNMNNNHFYSYLVIFGIESFLLSLILVYFIMSGFNKKNLKDTFITNEKKIIYILSLIILTFGFTIGMFNFSKISKNNNINVQANGNSFITYSSKNEINKSKTITSGEYTSSVADENAILVSGDIDVTLTDIKINKTGDSNGGDNTSFYGINSGIIAKDGANLSLKNISVITNATGANGVFSYGGSATTNNSKSDGTTVNISDSKIVTKKDNSGGIMTTGGGVMNASNLEIETAGVSSAAIRTDRGGGEVNVDGGTYKTTGAGSPTVYSTANVIVKNADLISTTSEGIVIEGKNKVSLENVVLTDTNNKLNGQSTTYKNIFLYQSMSGDAAEGVSEFSSKNSTITTNKGDTLYVTNTSSKITLINNKIINNDDTGNFLRVQKDSWGNNGSNGGNVILIMSNQEAMGNIVIDEISTLDITLEDNSYYEGTINGDNSAKEIKLKLDASSKIKLTGNSYVTSIENEDLDYNNIDFNGYTLYVNGEAVN